MKGYMKLKNKTGSTSKQGFLTITAILLLSTIAFFYVFLAFSQTFTLQRILTRSYLASIASIYSKGCLHFVAQRLIDDHSFSVLFSIPYTKGFCQVSEIYKNHDGTYNISIKTVVKQQYVTVEIAKNIQLKVTNESFSILSSH